MCIHTSSRIQTRDPNVRNRTARTNAYYILYKSPPFFFILSQMNPIYFHKP